MKTSLLIALAALAAEPDPLDLDPQVHVLDNGLTVILEPITRIDSVALHLAYGVGSRDERDGEKGCAHLFEHLMFEGSANVPTSAFDQWLTAAGGWNNAWTSEDTTAYHETFPAAALDLALFLESDRMGFLEPGLTDDNVTNQRSVVLQERAEGYAQPNGRDWDAIHRLIYPADHPYHVPVIGTVADVSGFETPAVVDFWRRHYRPRNAVLTLVGNFDADEALEQVKHWFSDVPDAGAPEARAVANTAALEPAFRHGVLEDDVEERTVYLLWHTVPPGHPDAPALDVLDMILSYGQGTRMDDRLYYRSRLASDNGTGHYAMDLGGLFFASATSPKTSLKKLEKAMLSELQRLEKAPPTEAELTRARKALRGYLLDSLERYEDRAELLTDCYRRTGEANCLSGEWARYEAVTAEDVVRVARQYLRPDARMTLSVVPRGDSGALAGSQPVELP